MSNFAAIELKNVSKAFGDVSVIRNLSLQVIPKEITALIGASGCGKTTCLRLMNGLIHPSSGEVWIQGQPIDYSRSVELRRQMGYCLQGYTLFPHLNVFENVSLIAKKSGWHTRALKERAAEVLDLVHLPSKQYLLKRPGELSGGQRQRVGLARALFLKPEILLMDEPFGALDPITRGEIQDSLMELQKKLELTVVLVTHDLSEAFKMAQRLVLLHSGEIAQIGRPQTLLSSPANDYVSDFLKTNSPGHILKSITIMNLMEQDILLIRRAGPSRQLVHLESSENFGEVTEDQATQRIRSHGQSLRIETDEKGRLLHFSSLKDGREYEINKSLKDTDDLLEALNHLLMDHIEALPVVKTDGSLAGVFSRNTLRLLDQAEL